MLYRLRRTLHRCCLWPLASSVLVLSCSETTRPQLPLNGPWKSLAAGGSHTCGVTADGAAYCWGYNGDGAFGNGLYSNGSSVPVQVSGGFAFQLTQVGTGGFPPATGEATCGLTTAGSAYCWGWNTAGRLGDGTSTNRLAPVPVLGGQTYVDLAMQDDAICGVTTAGAVYCWGLNVGGVDTSAGPVITSPAPVVGGLIFASVTVGVYHACGLTGAGVAWCWGSNGAGQFGDGSDSSSVVPVPAGGGMRFAALSASGDYTCGLTFAGAAYCWGYDGMGQLGDGGKAEERKTPTAVVGGLTFASLSAGYGTTCGLTSSGTAYCWGDNFFGQLGNGNTTTSPQPLPVATELRFVSLTVGSDHTCGVTPGGAAYCWGDNAVGQLGDGTTVQRLRPVPVVNP